MKDFPNAALVLERLSQAYWYPLCAHFRRMGQRTIEAEDLTQAYFAGLLERDWLAAADRERG